MQNHTSNEKTNETVKYFREILKWIAFAFRKLNWILFIASHAWKICTNDIFPQKSCLRWIYERSNLIFPSLSFFPFFCSTLWLKLANLLQFNLITQKLSSVDNFMYAKKEFSTRKYLLQKVDFLHRVVSCFMQICESICSDISHTKHVMIRAMIL